MFKYYLNERIDSNNAAEFEADVFKAYEENGDLELDGRDLKYISSAGLRVILKLRKVQSNLEITHVDNDVYQILEVTGFTELVKVKRQLREISVEGCKILGKGGSGTVYRLNEDTIVKVFKEGKEYDDIDKERGYARTAFVAGIPTAISFDIVKVGSQLGAVFECMNSDTLSNAFKSHPEKFDEYIDKYVELYRLLSTTEVKDTFENIRELSLERLNRMEKFLGAQDTDILRNCVNAMPDSNTLVHGDFHPGNIMLQGDELMLIDMADLTNGPAKYDLLTLYRDIVVTTKTEVGIKYLESSVNINAELAIKIWDAFMDRVYDGDKEKIENVTKAFGMMYLVNALTAAGGESEGNIEMKLPYYKNMMEKIRPYKNELPDLFKKL